LKFSETERITLVGALNHPYFDSIRNEYGKVDWWTELREKEFM
jgi:hypothetical protein